eukprot:7006460-Karenia_brevis.AAC.1
MLHQHLEPRAPLTLSTSAYPCSCHSSNATKNGFSRLCQQLSSHPSLKSAALKLPYEQKISVPMSHEGRGLPEDDD